MKTTVSVEIKRRKSPVGWFWWGVFNYYCWKQALMNADVPESKISNALTKSNRLFVNGKEYHEQ